MNKFWDLYPALGEMIGSCILTFGIMIILFFEKKKSFGVDTPLRKRLFLGSTIPLLVVMALMASVGFGGFGHINPGVTLIVAGINEHYEAVPVTIGFQLIGSLIAIGIFLIVILALDEWKQLEKSFSFLDQSPQHTATIEVIGNMFWFLPITAIVVWFMHQTGQIDFFELAITAAIGQVVLLGVFSEFGAANFNAQVWFGKFIVTFIAKKKITGKQLAAELSGLTTTLAIGAALGPLGRVFYLNTH